MLFPRLPEPDCFTIKGMTRMTHPSTVQNPVKTIRFVRRGEVFTLGNVPPSRTLLELLREDLGLTGSKEGCGEGDCGACTVVLGEAQGGAMTYRAVNSCIRLAHSIDGMALWTVEDLAAADGSLHPAQQSMVDCHGSQCGFCTPGFVMSLFGMYQNHVAPTLATACAALPPEGALRLRPGEAGSAAPADGEDASKLAVCQPITRALAQEELSGNLCRCTGYRPILDAAQSMAALPRVAIDETALLSILEQLVPVDIGLEADFAYKTPRTLAQLLQWRAAHPQAQLVAGCTDVGLWVTKQHRQFEQVIDLTQVGELRRIEPYPQHLAIGAAVTLQDAFAALAIERPQLQTFFNRFAGLPVRNSGTLGGNVANGSPIGDAMPLLIALGAHVVLMSWRAGQQISRELPLENLYSGYRKNVMAADEVLAWIKVPRPGRPHPSPIPVGEAARGNDVGSKQLPALAPSPPWGEGGGEGLSEFLRVYKISKRYDDDISAVCLALNLQIKNGTVQAASIGAGGVAATPVRALKTEAALLGQPWTEATVKKAMAELRAEFSPISDMRASSAYRTRVLGNLLQRYWLESQGVQQINLASFTLRDVA